MLKKKTPWVVITFVTRTHNFSSWASKQVNEYYSVPESQQHYRHQWPLIVGTDWMSPTIQPTNLAWTSKRSSDDRRTRMHVGISLFLEIKYYVNTKSYLFHSVAPHCASDPFDCVTVWRLRDLYCGVEQSPNDNIVFVCQYSTLVHIAFPLSLFGLQLFLTSLHLHQ